jgi:hypothetical protein
MRVPWHDWLFLRSTLFRFQLPKSETDSFILLRHLRDAQFFTKKRDLHMWYPPCLVANYCNYPRRHAIVPGSMETREHTGRVKFYIICGWMILFCPSTPQAELQTGNASANDRPFVTSSVECMHSRPPAKCPGEDRLGCARNKANEAFKFRAATVNSAW